ncbi:alpha/beta hydrolase, partial [Klebsiella aerogenes]|uniref:alpha/beta hydrolase n=1 Tax=Klebsiella aerogenes TaxID=548 RepID=UPI000AC67EFE
VRFCRQFLFLALRGITAAFGTVEIKELALNFRRGSVQLIHRARNVCFLSSFDFYRTERGGYTPQGEKEELTTKPMLSSIGKFMNFYPFNDIETISPRPMLFITGDQAHSKEFSEDAFKRAGQPKELYVVPGAGHVDLYDRTDVIPFDKLTDFFRNNLK